MLRGVNEQTFQKLQLGEGAFLNTKYTKGTQLTPDMIALSLFCIVNWHY